MFKEARAVSPGFLLPDAVLANPARPVRRPAGWTQRALKTTIIGCSAALPKRVVAP